jgi:hypothetical protein
MREVFAKFLNWLADLLLLLRDFGRHGDDTIWRHRIGSDVCLDRPEFPN